jgi:hypothetical protein
MFYFIIVRREREKDKSDPETCRQLAVPRGMSGSNHVRPLGAADGRARCLSHLLFDDDDDDDDHTTAIRAHTRPQRPHQMNALPPLLI